MAWLLLAFLTTFIVTRGITRLIRSGRGPFKDTTIGSVHIHHQVYGIFLMLGAGVGEFTYRPDSPWFQVLAALFGAGAALTLDEFALWLHVDDVYWSQEGRKSVDAVLVAAVIGTLLLLGANPFDTGEDGGATPIVLIATLAFNLLCSVVSIAKGKVSTGIIGLVTPVVSLVGALRLAKPNSPWARWRYRPDSRRLARSEARFPPGRRTRWEAVKDAIGGGTAARQP